MQFGSGFDVVYSGVARCIRSGLQIVQFEISGSVFGLFFEVDFLSFGVVLDSVSIFIQNIEFYV